MGWVFVFVVWDFLVSCGWEFEKTRIWDYRWDYYRLAHVKRSFHVCAPSFDPKLKRTVSVKCRMYTISPRMWISQETREFSTQHLALEWWTTSICKNLWLSVWIGLVTVKMHITTTTSAYTSTCRLDNWFTITDLEKMTVCHNIARPSVQICLIPCFKHTHTHTDHGTLHENCVNETKWLWHQGNQAWRNSQLTLGSCCGASPTYPIMWSLDLRPISSLIVSTCDSSNIPIANPCCWWCSHEYGWKPQFGSI